MITLPRLLAALASGLVLNLVSPPYGLHFLHWFAFLPLLWAMREDDNRGNAVVAYIAGYAAVSTLFFWLSESVVRFSNIPGVLSYVVVHLFGLGFAIPYAIVFGLVHPLRKRLGLGWVLIFPALQVATEFLGPALFPYYQGVSQYRTPWTWQLASVTGVYGLSYLIMLVNAALAELIFRRREGRSLPLGMVAAVAVLWLANLGFGAWRTDKVDSEVETWPRIKVSQLQQSITMEERMAGSARDATLSWVKITSELAKMDEQPDLVVWPEGAIPFDPRSGRVAQLVGNTARNIQAPLLMGGGFAEPMVDPASGRKYVEQRNSIYLFSSQGELQQRYDKIVPLPFGEYMPLSDTFPFLKTIIQGPGDFQAGTNPVVFEITTNAGQHVRFTTPICYEAILSPLVRTQLSDAELYVNVTNDGWFGDTAAPHQHAMLSAVRSIENGLPMVRFAYTGVSMNVSPTGRITEETAPFTDVIGVIETPVGRVVTAYSKVGDLFAWLCVLMVVVGGGVASRRSPVTSDAASS